MHGRELRRSVTLSEQLSVVDSASLEDLLKLREEEESLDSSLQEGGSVNQESGIAREKREGSTDSDDSSGGSGGSVGRTLIDIILQEHEVNGSTVDGNSSSAAAWKSLRDHFRLHSPGSACEAASLERLQPNSDPEPVGSAAAVTEDSVPEPIIVAPAAAVAVTEAPVLPLSNASDNTPEDSVPGGAVDSSALVAAPEEEEEEEEEEEPTRVSLMALLEQTDRQWGGSGGGDDLSLVGAVAEEAAADEPESGGGAMSYMCCVCMIRHKGAAFIPCGHTFCRLCSRELWISRGNCPLCNRHIVEILDIF